MRKGFVVLGALFCANLAWSVFMWHHSSDVLSQQRHISDTLAKHYERGFAAGVEAQKAKAPLQCVSWWFDPKDIKERTADIRKAYCKGNYGPKAISK